MGALHEGHLSLVDASLRENDVTIVSIFVNPAQFAPHEDLSSYPRTLDSDLAQLQDRLARSNTEKPLSVLIPTVHEMYPNGFTQEVSKQVGAFVEVKGLSHQMEGLTRPTFFRGVATVVTKLLNIVMPDRAYFGQKDIQQAVVLRRLVDDLLFRYPNGSQNVRVLPTSRDTSDNVALSSRNAYLDQNGRYAAPILHQALSSGKQTWERLLRQDITPSERIQATLNAVNEEAERGKRMLREAYDKNRQGAHVELDYVCLNDPSTLEDLTDTASDSAILSGALWVYNDAKDPKPATRLIDNMLLGFSMNV
ncbi:pantoate--beta-alanine ligase (AMP-forming) [Malassezia yamatoensis]|uniref:Pantoate--beta-alanine ligase n=1 Tax=Malassezia yamatoensis TaxID=253288 RepID=A0AAJ5YQM0_9BASI|nr:pantoate--beta-alanine ligase (AMP-forming) [Malassezia yamatoensis]